MNDEIVTILEVGRAPKNALTELRARILDVRGRKCADLRTFAQGPTGPTPTKAGLCVAVENFAPLAALVVKLARAAEAAAPKESTHPGPASDSSDNGAGGDGPPAPNQESEA